jgi:predicted tellurium resistance membrane protein TerC
MIELFSDPNTWAALATLIFLEIVLGIDNIIFISLITTKLEVQHQRKARLIGLTLAMVFRIGLLLSISWIIQFSEPLFSLFGHPISGRDLILLAGGLFLIAKSVSEISHKFNVEMNPNSKETKVKHSLRGAIFQIILLDLVFSFDSILTAIGMTSEITLMVIAVIVSVIVMMLFAGPVSAFIQKHPTLQILALSFLILIGFMLGLEGLGKHIEKGYIYFAVFFAFSVEVVNMIIRNKREKHQ